MSTNFSNSEILPPKLRFKLIEKMELAKNSQASSSSAALPKSSLSSTINENKSETSPPEKFKSALNVTSDDEKNGVISSKGKADPSSSKHTTCSSSKQKGESLSRVKTTKGTSSTNWTSKIPFSKTYNPSEEEFKDPMAYIEKITEEASKFGICKIVPPVSPSVPTATVLNQVLKPAEFLGEFLPLQTGYREVPYVPSSIYTIHEFQKMADEFYMDKYQVAAQLPPSLMEKDFWKRVSRKDSEKTQHVSGLKASAFSSDHRDPLASTKWNLKNFARLPQSSLRFLNGKKKYKGVMDPTVSMGMLWSYTYWYAEPGHLYRIDYHHCGAPRTWYGTPNSDTYNFETVAEKFVHPQEDLQIYEAFDLLNLKRHLFSPSTMVKHDVPIYKIVQYPGEFIITFPRSYHMSFSHGFSCWESVNFATPHWFAFGDEASDRRAFYSRPQDVPYQELLFKEVMYLYNNNVSDLNSPTYRSLKAHFLCLIRMHRFAFKEMKKKTGAECCLIESGSKILTCGACFRQCYLAYVKCDCYSYPLCIFHDIYKKCPCKDSRLMAVREEFMELDAIAKKFESDEAKTDEGEPDEGKTNDTRTDEGETDEGDADEGKTNEGNEFLKEVDELFNIKFVSFKARPIPPPDCEKERKAQHKGKGVSLRVPKNGRAKNLVIRGQAEYKEESARVPKKPRTKYE